MKDGWHIICGHDVYVEGDKVLRGMKRDSNGSPVSAYPYRHNRRGGWDNASGVSVSAFRSAIKRGTMKMA